MEDQTYTQKLKLAQLLLLALFTWRWPTQIGEVTCGGSSHLSCKRVQIKMRDYMDRRVTPPKRVTSPAWGPPPPCNPALTLGLSYISSASFTHLTFTCVHTEKLRDSGNKPKHNLFQNGKNKKM